MEDGCRIIGVGMTVEASGKFIVSIFDKNDREHLLKKQRYQVWKRKQDNREDNGTSITVSDGSFYSLRKNGAAAWIILTPDQSEWIDGGGVLL